MRFLNRKTGVIVDLPLEAPGGDWVPVESDKAQEKPAEEKTVPKQKSKAPVQEEVTKKDIMQELDAFGVEYNPKAKKEELYQLMKERLHGDHKRR
ncbi:hypothetical protein K5I04_04885 [Murdochiella sp. Marseille-P8839]|nr:hypothetical protein [Murdochiella sp. Marseille-P8839]